jgi:NADH dehydrogenase subunit E
VIQGLEKKIRENNLASKIELNGSFCTGECEKGVCVKIDEELFSVSPETVDKFFEEEVLRRVH